MPPTIGAAGLRSGTATVSAVSTPSGSGAACSAFAVAERHYQKNDDGQLIKDKVYVSLHLERDGDDERWVVDEIKSIR